MSVDKGSEVSHPPEAFKSRRPPEVFKSNESLVKDLGKFYFKENSSAFVRAISRASEALRRKGRQLPTNETIQRVANSPEPQPNVNHDYIDRTRIPSPGPKINLSRPKPSGAEKYFGPEETKKPSEE